VPVAGWGPGLLAVPVHVAERDAVFVLDTGAGITSLDETYAREVGLRPWGRYSGHRMSGERLDLQRAEDVSLEIGGRTIRRESVGVLDFRRLLPAGTMPPSGILGLDALEHVPFVLDLASDSLTLLGGSQELDDATRGWTAVDAVPCRTAGGVALELFLRVRASGVALTLQVDTGSNGPAILSSHAAAALGVRDGAVELPIGPGLPAKVAVRELIYDGNLGLGVLRGCAFAMDLAAARVRVRLPDRR
jgi:predicted aspartyl protease